jgi:hypothetical protein
VRARVKCDALGLSIGKALVSKQITIPPITQAMSSQWKDPERIRERGACSTETTTGHQETTGQMQNRIFLIIPNKAFPIGDLRRRTKQKGKIGAVHLGISNRPATELLQST